MFLNHQELHEHFQAFTESELITKLTRTQSKKLKTAAQNKFYGNYISYNEKKVIPKKSEISNNCI